MQHLLQTLTQFKIILKHNRYRLFLSFVYISSGYAIYHITENWLWFLCGYLWAKVVLVFGHNIAMHRYYTHKSFECNSFTKPVLLLFSFLAGFGSPISFARNHRQHHRVADTDADYHSPSLTSNLFVGLGLWEFKSVSWFLKKGGLVPRDLLKDKSILFIHNNYYLLWTSLILLTSIINYKITLFLLCLPIFIIHLEINFFGNFIGHSYGYRNFNTNDKSKNNNLAQWWLLGDGLHNNHHADPGLYNQKVYKKDAFDLSGWIVEKCLIK